MTPPLLGWRIDYADGTSHHNTDGPITRTTGVLAVVWWQTPPYRYYAHGSWTDPVATVDGVDLSGVTIPDDDWAAYQTALMAEPHPYAKAGDI